MLEVYDSQMRKKAILHLAFDRTEEQKINGVGTFKFSLPSNDPKAEHCRPFAFIRNDGGDFYRLLDEGLTVEDTGERQYVAEHCIATLVDDVMFRTTILGGHEYYTREIIEYILAKQTVVRWQLGECDFDFQFEYGFESENLLNALFAVPNLFVDPYMWVYDMDTAPWTVSLKRIDTQAHPQFYIRAGKNLMASTTSRRGADVCTRLYLLGYGEGDNQLTIGDVNGGLPYLQSPQEYIDRYGLISKVYVDRAFEDAESLMERGRALLNEMQDPPRERTFDVADLYRITHQAYDDARLGAIVKLAEDDTTTYITGIRRELDSDGDMQLTLSTKATDLAADIADLADRQRIEQVYAQGATQIYAQSIQANADTKTQAVLNFFIPQEMRIVNRVAAKLTVDSFRSYNRVTNGGGGSTSTSSDGGGGATTSGADGGSTNTSTADGSASLSADQILTYTPQGGYSTSQPSISTTGQTNLSTNSAAPSVSAAAAGTSGGPSTTNTTSAAAAANESHAHGLNSHTHTITSTHTHAMAGHTHTVSGHTHTMGHYHDFNHTHYVPGHTHALGTHTHRVSVPSHSHSVSLPTHSHSVTIPEHTHNIEQGIFRFGSPTGAGVYINGTHQFDMAREREIDLTPYLLGSDGKIPRNSWIRVGILPNALAYITIDLTIQGFVQSRGGGSY